MIWFSSRRHARQYKEGMELASLILEMKPDVELLWKVGWCWCRCKGLKYGDCEFISEWTGHACNIRTCA